MSEIVDDLLQEVEQLEEVTQELDSTLASSKKQNEQLQEAQHKASSEVHLLALETAKTAQEASSQSNQAAQASIKQAETLKAQILELNESNFNWRQSVRNASKDFKSAKSSFSIMVTTTLVFCMITLGVMGYLFYAMQKEEAKFKGEVLDIIATENALLNKKITLKVDELASVIENLNYEVSKLNSQQMTSQKSAHTVDSSSQAKPTEIAMIDPIPEIKEMTKDAPKETTPQTEPEKSTSTSKTETVVFDSKALSEPLNWIKENTVTHQELDELKQLVDELLLHNKKLSAQVQEQSSIPAVTASLSDNQVKKLNDISWLVRKNGKAIKALENKLGSSQSSGKNVSLVQELKTLSHQQSLMQSQLIEMQKVLKKMKDKINEPPPYSYKAK